LKRRPMVFIYMDILTVLRDGPAGPTRLARTCNIPYDRLNIYVPPLLGAGFVTKSVEQEREYFRATRDGIQWLEEMERNLKKLNL